MTELNDHLKLLFARAGGTPLPALRQAGAPRHAREHRRPDARRAIRARRRPAAAADLPGAGSRELQRGGDQGAARRQGYTRIHEKRGDTLQVVQDRFRWSSIDRAGARERCHRGGAQGGAGTARCISRAPRPATRGAPWRFSTGLHCPDCDIAYKDPSPSTFSFNSPIGACETCRGFGRIIGVDYGLVIPDDRLSLRAGRDQDPGRRSRTRNARPIC